MLVRIQRCKFCRREMNVSALGYQENPFCSLCLHDRMQQAADKRGPVEWVDEDGHYAVLKPIAARTPA